LFGSHDGGGRWPFFTLGWIQKNELLDLSQFVQQLFDGKSRPFCFEHFQLRMTFHVMDFQLIVNPDNPDSWQPPHFNNHAYWIHGCINEHLRLEVEHMPNFTIGELVGLNGLLGELHGSTPGRVVSVLQDKHGITALDEYKVAFEGSSHLRLSSFQLTHVGEGRGAEAYDG